MLSYRTQSNVDVGSMSCRLLGADLDLLIHVKASESLLFLVRFKVVDVKAKISLTRIGSSCRGVIQRVVIRGVETTQGFVLMALQPE